MPITNRYVLHRVLGATMLLTLTAFPLRAHQVEPPTAPSPVQSTSEVTATGAVVELIVENTITNVTLRYLGLRLDDGHTVGVAGSGVDTLSNGVRVNATGTLAGNVFNVNSFSIVAPPESAVRKTALAQTRKTVTGILAIHHKDYFAEGHSEYGLAVANSAGQLTPLNVAVIPDAIRPGTTERLSGTTAADGPSR